MRGAPGGHVADQPKTLSHVWHTAPGEFDLTCSDEHESGDWSWTHAVHLPHVFPRLRSLTDLPEGHVAVFSEPEGRSLHEVEPDDAVDDGDAEAKAASVPLDDWEWTCSCCGERKKGLPEIAGVKPAHALGADDDPDREIVEVSSDLCRVRIDGEIFHFVRGLLPVTVRETGETYCFGVWTTLSEANYQRYKETFQQDQTGLGEMFGYLSNDIAGLPAMQGMHLDVIPGAKGKRPWLMLWQPDEEHELFDAQQRGVPIERVIELVSAVLPCEGSA